MTHCLTTVMLLLFLLFPAHIQAEDQAGQEKTLDQKLQPSNQWIERKVSPYSQWVESVLHDWQLGRNKQDKQIRSTYSSRPLAENELSEQQAVALVLAKYTGEVLSVRAKLFQQQPSFRIQMLSSQGRVKVFYIHRLTGAFLTRRKQPQQRTE